MVLFLDGSDARVKRAQKVAADLVADGVLVYVAGDSRAGSSRGPGRQFAPLEEG